MYVPKYDTQIEAEAVTIPLEKRRNGSVAGDRWEDALICSESSGTPKPILANAITALRCARIGTEYLHSAQRQSCQL